ncbi:TorF family putative porin [Pseudomonas sp. PB3P13]
MKHSAFVISSFSIFAVSQSATAIELSDEFQLVVNAGVFSEYTSRGLSITQRKPAVQGSVVLAHSSGLYAGVWSSNVDTELGDTHYETDYYAGYLWQPIDALSLDIGYLQYTYPGLSSLNLAETYGILNYKGFKLGSYYSSDSGGDQSTTYNYVGYETSALPYAVKLDLRYGIADYKDPTFFSSSGSGKDSYREWEVKLTKAFVGIDFSASYIGTNLSESECFSYLLDNESCGPRLLLGASKTF